MSFSPFDVRWEPTPSQLAFQSIDTSDMRRRILAYFTLCKTLGFTDDELEEVMNLRHQTLSARRRELVLQCRIKDSGLRRKTRSGRTATVWVVT